MFQVRRSRRATPSAPRPAPIPAASAMLAAAHADRPFGFAGGEMLASPTPTPPPTLAQPLQIEPPPWQGKVAVAPQPEPTEPTLSALDAIKAAEATDDDWPQIPLGPPVVVPPLERPKIPPADWRQEQTARVEDVLPQIESPGARLTLPAPRAPRRQS